MMNSNPRTGFGGFRSVFDRPMSRRRRSVSGVGRQIERLERREYLSSLDGIAPDATTDRIDLAFIAFDSVSLSGMSG